MLMSQFITQLWENNMNDRAVFGLAMTFILTFVILSKVMYSIPFYAFDRLGVTKDSVTLSLWLLVSISIFVVMVFSEKMKILKSLSLIVVTTFLYSLSHYVSGVLGSVVDFTGVGGLKIIAPIYFVLSFFSGLLGMVLSLPFVGLKGTKEQGVSTEAGCEQ